MQQMQGQKCSVIRVDKKTSLLVYRADAPDSILKNNRENASTHKIPFTTALKSIFTPSASSFSVEAAAAKREADRVQILGSGRASSNPPPQKRNEIIDTDSLSSVGSGSTYETSSDGSPKSPKVCFAKPPIPDRPRGRSASITCGVAARAAMLRGEISPEPNASQLPMSPPSRESALAVSDEDDEEEEEEEPSVGRAICRNNTLTEREKQPQPIRRASSTDSSNSSTASGKQKSKLRNPFSRRNSSPVVYEVVSNEEADRMISKQAAESAPRVKNGDLKVVPEEGWFETVEDVEHAQAR